MDDPDLREFAFDVAEVIADELERSDQSYVGVRLYDYAPQITITRHARDMIERYVRRAIEADREVRAGDSRCPSEA